MNYQNNAYPNYGYGYGNQMVYNPGMKVPLFTNPLTAEQIATLRRNANVSSCPPVTETEYLQGICTHRDTQKGTWTLEPYGDDGYFRCTICGDIVKPSDFTVDQVKAITEDFISVMQTAKLNFLDMSDASIKDFFKMLPLVKRMPAIYEQALNVINKYDNNNMFAEQGANGNLFQLFSAVTNPGFNPMMMMPGYGAGAGQMDPQQMAAMQQQMMMQQQQQMMAAQQATMGQNGTMPMYNGMSPFYGDPNQMAMMQQQAAAAQMQAQAAQGQQVQGQAQGQQTATAVSVEKVMNV